MLTIVLQAGGKSTRMGTDKALLPFLGIPMIEILKICFQNNTNHIAVGIDEKTGYFSVNSISLGLTNPISGILNMPNSQSILLAFLRSFIITHYIIQSPK